MGQIMRHLVIGGSTYDIPSGDAAVTSVGLANGINGGLTISGSPITTNGVITIKHTNILSNTQETQAVYPIKIDKNGHISAYGAAVTIPTISLNGNTTTSPSFYAPTAAGTSGYYLRSNGSGAPSWAEVPEAVDEKVKQIPSVNNAAYEILFSGSANNNELTESARKSSTLKYNPYNQVFINTGEIRADKGVFNQLIATRANIQTLDVENLTAQNATIVGLLDVKGELHTNSWTNANIANIGGSFYITPTIEPTNNSTTISITKGLNANWQIVLSGNFATDFIKTGEATSGVNWPSGSLVLITGDIVVKDMTYPLGTLKGTLQSQVNASAATTSKTITIVSITDRQGGAPSVLDSLWDTNGQNIVNAPFSNGKISLYKIGNYPIGIQLSSMGVDANSIIDIYGGVQDTPNVRIGHLNDIPSYTDSAGNTRKPQGWGIYTDHGYFKGTIVADRGSIGHFTVNNNAIYSGSHSAYNSNNTGIFLGRPSDESSDYYISGGPNALWYLKSDGSAKIGAMELTSSGLLTVPAASISGALTAATISANSLTAGTINSNILTASNVVTDTLEGGTFNTDAYIRVSTQDSQTIKIGNSASNKVDWRIIAGKSFGVDKAGNLYATNADITGAITASSLTINSGTTITDSAGLISNNAIEIGGRNLMLVNNVELTDDEYQAARIYLTEPLEAEQTYTLQLWGVNIRHDGKTASAIGSAIYYCGGTIKIGGWSGTTYFTEDIDDDNIKSYSADYLYLIFTPHINASATTEGGNISSNYGIADVIDTESPFINIYNSVPSINGEYEKSLSIERYKLEKGNKLTDWSIAPEDTEVIINNSNYELQLRIDEEISNLASGEALSNIDAIVKKYLDVNGYLYSNDGYLELGQSRSQDAYKLILTPEALVFRAGKESVASMSNEELTITKTNVAETMRMGNFIWTLLGEGTNKRLILKYSAQ